MWSDGFYGDWYINPAINYIQFEKHFGRGYGYTQYSRGMRIFQVIDKVRVSVGYSQS
jgi:hypothetical protein